MGDEHVRQAAAGSAFTVLWWVTIIQSQRLQLRVHHDLTSVLSLTSHLSTISFCLLLHISGVYLLCFSTRWFPVICLDITVQIIYIMWPIMKFQCNKQDVKKNKTKKSYYIVFYFTFFKLVSIWGSNVFLKLFGCKSLNNIFYSV